jgi:hypothetical protein
VLEEVGFALVRVAGSFFLEPFGLFDLSNAYGTTVGALELVVLLATKVRLGLRIRLKFKFFCGFGHCF